MKFPEPKELFKERMINSFLLAIKEEYNTRSDLPSTDYWYVCDEKIEQYNQLIEWVKEL